MKRLTKVAAVGAAALGLLASTTPAHAAADLGVIAFVGTATFLPWHIYPTPGAVGSTGNWVLTSITAVEAHTHGPQPGLALGTASISIFGDLKAGAVQQFAAKQFPPLGYLDSGGFCGASGGSGGTGTVNISAIVGASANVPVSNVGWIQSAASLIVFQGDTPAGVDYLAGVVSTIPPRPDPGAPSCANGTAFNFHVVGALVAFF